MSAAKHTTPTTPRRSARAVQPTARKMGGISESATKRKEPHHTGLSSDEEITVRPALPKRAKVAPKNKPDVYELSDSDKEVKAALPAVTMKAKKPQSSSKTSPAKKLAFGSFSTMDLEDLIGSPPRLSKLLTGPAMPGAGSDDLEEPIMMTPKRARRTDGSSNPVTPTSPRKRGSLRPAERNTTPTTPSPAKRNKASSGRAQSVKKPRGRKNPSPSPEVLAPDSDADDEGNDEGDNESLPESILPRHMQQRAVRTKGRPSEPKLDAISGESDDENIPTVKEEVVNVDSDDDIVESEEETVKKTKSPPVRKGKQRRDNTPQASDEEAPNARSPGSTNVDDIELASEPEETGVLRISRQDPLLHTFYNDIKFAHKEVNVSPGYVSDKKPPAATGIIFKGLCFETHAPYVNPASFDPKLLGVQPGKQHLLLQNEPAVIVMVGMGPACELVNAATLSSKSKTQLVRQIGFVPGSEQHWYLLLSALGQKFSFKEAKANMDGSMIYLSTRPEQIQDDDKNDGLKASDLADVLTQSPSPKKPKSSAKPKSGFNSAQKYPTSRAFEDGAPPIYDGRPTQEYPGFKFKPEDFDNIRKLPVYADGLEDVPARSIIAAGFTTNTYHKDSRLYLSGNIQFVILLGIVE